MSRLAFVCAVLVLVAISLRAQDSGVELYQYNYSFLNPSFAGKDKQKISMLAKITAYSGAFDDQFFSTAFLSYENYFNKLNSGVALTGFSQTFGVAATTSLALTYNYHFKITDDITLIPAIRVRRQTVSVDFSFYRPIDPVDPVIIGEDEPTETNWTGDLGVAFTFKSFDIGLSAANLFYTKNRTEIANFPSQLDKFYTVLARGSFKINQHLSSEHSLYIPLLNGEFDRIDINNTLVINDLFIAGLSLERNTDDTLLRINTGFKVKDFFRIVMLAYSNSDEIIGRPLRKFRGEIYTEFKF